MAKIDIDNDGKADFSITLPNIVMILGGVISLVSSYYMLDSKIEKAMVNPPQEVVKRDLDALKNETDLKLQKLEKQIEDLNHNLTTYYKRK